MENGHKKYLVVNFYESTNSYCIVKLATDSKKDAEDFASAWNRNVKDEKYVVFENISATTNKKIDYGKENQKAI